MTPVKIAEISALIRRVRTSILLEIAGVTEAQFVLLMRELSGADGATLSLADVDSLRAVIKREIDRRIPIPDPE
jgi:hypothetical protein